MSAASPILVGTDFSAGAAVALERAAWLAARWQAPVHLVHVADTGGFAALLHEDGPTAAREQLRAAAQARLDEAAEGLHSRLTALGAGALTVTNELLEGPAAPTLLEAAHAVDARILVLGAHSGDTWRQALIGSTTERVLAKTAWPTLVARIRPVASYQRLLVPVDFSGYSLPALRTALNVAGRSPDVADARIRVVHIFQPPFEGALGYARVESKAMEEHVLTMRTEAERQLDALVNRSGAVDPVQILRDAVHGPILRALHDTLQSDRSDLVVIGKHGKGRLESFFLGSATRFVLSHTACDVLVTTQAE